MAPTTRSQTVQTRAKNVNNDMVLPDVQTGDQSSKAQIQGTTDASTTVSGDEPKVAPVYTIDLSLPPEQRYATVATDFKETLERLTQILDQLLDEFKIPKLLFHVLARIFLRGLHSKEQTSELRGISKATGLSMYLLVAYNVLLDLLMGCTSGGILIKGKDREAKMTHFRTLDWGMPELRDVLAIYEFVERPGGKAIARSINYVGFVGILTGVRQGLSLSLNFRPYHNNDSSRWSNFKFHAHLALVLLGFRPSLASHLREFLIPSTTPTTQTDTNGDEEGRKVITILLSSPSHSLADIARDFPSVPTTAAYLTFCSGSQTVVLEKDRVTAKVLQSTAFLAVTNHDASYEQIAENDAQAAYTRHVQSQSLGVGMEDIVAESIERKQCLKSKWEEHCKTATFSKGRKTNPANEKGVSVELLREWLEEHPIVNDETHFVAIMDPIAGKFEYVQAYREPEYFDDKEDEE